MSGKLVLIDGHSILHRTFYGLPDLTNSQGLHTNAVYGFLNILTGLIEDEKPEYLAVAFDVHAPTFRHEVFAAYKGTRKPMPEELREQIPLMKQVLQTMGIRTVEKAGLEADDILGTLAKRGQKEGLEVILMSGDRDLLQVADEHICIRIPKTKGGRTEIENYYPKDVEAAFGVDPLAFIDLKALMGDTSDNIPGVPKVGKKTAEELMVTYGSLDAIYEHVEEITKKSIRESLIENRELAYLSQYLARINVEAPLEVTIDELKLGAIFNADTYELFKKLEFKNLLNRFDSLEAAPTKTEIHVQTTLDLMEAEEVFARAKNAEQIAYLLLEDGTTAARYAADLPAEAAKGPAPGFAGLALAFEEEVWVFLPQGFLTAEYLCEQMTELASACKSLATYGIKTQYPVLDVDDTARFFDVLLAAYLLNPLKSDTTIADIANEHLGQILKERSELLGKLTLKQAADKQPEDLVTYGGQAVRAILEAVPVLQAKLEESSMDRLFREIEMPLTRVLYDMEAEGIRVRPEELKNYGDALTGRIDELEKAICEAAGESFNINSPKQLGEILFEKLGLPGGKKTKTGYSTAADVLEKMASEYPIVSDILEYRGLTKLKSTYADGLAAFIGREDRIHTTLNQTITATGRISSTEPNLQNIPMRMELGRLIRKVFIPREGYIFTDADYSQIELRVLASIAGDVNMIQAYRSNADIHRTTAASVFHTPYEEVTDLQRRNAKAVNFGIVYGISAFGLSQDLNISRGEASDYIDAYFASFPGIKEYLDKAVEDGKENGSCVTIFGRRRPIPELKSSNFMQRSFGERVAMNAPIQGAAADIIKIAMIRVWKRIREEQLASRLILQIHDELLVETAAGEEAQVAQILAEEMPAAADLAVKLEIDMHTGTDWYEAK